VEQNDFFGFFQPHLENIGYSSTYSTKQNATDGCATFFKAERFAILDIQTLKYNDICSLEPSIVQSGQDAYHRLLPFQNIALVTTFQNRFTGKSCRIVNTHLHWNPEYADTKLLQCVILVDFLKQLESNYDTLVSKDGSGRDSDSSLEANIRKKRKTKAELEKQKVPIVLASDLNSLPDSAVLAFLLRGYSHQRHFHGHKFGRFSRTCALQHKFRFQSVYPLGLSSPEGRASGSDGTKNTKENSEQQESVKKKLKPWDYIPFTNCTPDFKGIIDYILYTPELRCVEYLSNLSPRRGSSHLASNGKTAAPTEPYHGLSSISSFPDELFPSDHLPLLAVFQESSQAVHSVGF
jgi:CCR4-NOT transcription complex subunit 6